MSVSRVVIWGVAVLGLVALFRVLFTPRSIVGTEKYEKMQRVSEFLADQPVEEAATEESGLQKATFGAGCFWCVEAVFEQLEGVESVTSGYAGGEVENPTYEQVCTKTTGHAEVIQIEYDPAKVSYQKLLEVFWTTHDPTTPNQQGADIGPQYRSAVFYHNEHQQKLAEQFKQKLNDENVFGVPVVTEISPLSNYYPAEDYHQEYFRNHQTQPYCMMVIHPKVEAARKLFARDLKSGE